MTASSSRTPSLQREIIRYYEECEADYRLVWDLDASLAMHIGYWDWSTWTLRGALARQNEVLADFGGVHRGDTVLDAGCGVGGSSIFLAQRYECTVHGITLSEAQVRRGRDNAAKARVADSVRFSVMDYCRTAFPDDSFDVVWALESLCYAPDFGAFTSEAFRVLKPGGVLVFADGFQTREFYAAADQEILDLWLHSWAVERLPTRPQALRALRASGFVEEHVVDIMRYVMPSARLLYLNSLYALPLGRVLQWLGCRTERQQRNVAGAYYQYEVCRRDLARYAMVSARKPAARRGTKRRTARAR